MASFLDFVRWLIEWIEEKIKGRPRFLDRLPFEQPHHAPQLPDGVEMVAHPDDAQQIWLVGEVPSRPLQRLKRVCYLVFINLELGNSIRFLDLTAAEPAFPPTYHVADEWFDFIATIGRRLEMPTPAIRVGEPARWRDFGVQQASRQNLKVVAPHVPIYG